MTDTAPRTPGRVARGGRDYTPVIREHLRTEILDGRLIPGQVINQARVAAEFGVSRGPVREAFRLLESDGLIDARVNHRARVRGLSVEDLEHLYTLRVLNESLALAVSVPRFSEDELDDLDRMAAALRSTDTASFDFDSWEELHQRFHTLLLAHSGAGMRGSAADWAARTQRYRRVYAADGHALPQGAAEHAEMARLCRERDTRGASVLLAEHLARAALSLVAQIAPVHDPALLRTAIRQVVGGA